MPPVFHSPHPDSAAAAPWRQAFSRCFNLLTVAGVFYLAAALALAREVSMLRDWPGAEWLAGWAQYTRQCLISGLSLLLVIALAEAALAALRWRRQPALLLRASAVAAGAVLGAVLRYGVATSFSQLGMIKWPWLAATVGVWLLLGGLGYTLLRLLSEEASAQAGLAEAQHQRQLLAAQQMEAQLLALNAQIEPHFLFNTLANVKRLFETEPERGRQMLSSLIAYLRAALPSMRESSSTLGRELELAHSYLNILQMRMGERLQFSVQADGALMKAAMPPMILATLVENAIKHGLSPLPQGGRIVISAETPQAGQLVLEVRDNGRGFVADGGTGVGLANTRARLAALYGSRAGLELEAAQPSGVVARLRLPLSAQAGAA